MPEPKSKDKKTPAKKADEYAASKIKSLHAAEYDEIRRQRMEQLKAGETADG